MEQLTEADKPGSSRENGITLLSRWRSPIEDDFQDSEAHTPSTRSRANLTNPAPREPQKGAKDPDTSSLNDENNNKREDTSQAKKSKAKGSKKSSEKDRSSTDKRANESESLASVFKESFKCLADSMKSGFADLSEMIKTKNNNPVHADNEDLMSSSSYDSSDDDETESESDREPPAKKHKQDDASETILHALEKNYKVLDQEGPELHSSLEKIITNMIKDKLDDDKVNDLKKRYPKPKNCELLAETTVNLPIWNNLSEKARVSDVKLQRSQKSLIKGLTAVITVLNELINKEPEWPPKQKILDTLMDSVQLLTNANKELNIRRREALRGELHSSYRHLCSASNPITTQLFGDDLNKAVKDITDTNKITNRDNKYKKDHNRSRDYAGGYDRHRPTRRFKDYSWSKNFRRPFYKKEGAKKSGQKNQH